MSVLNAIWDAIASAGYYDRFILLPLAIAGLGTVVGRLLRSRLPLSPAGVRRALNADDYEVTFSDDGRAVASFRFDGRRVDALEMLRRLGNPGASGLFQTHESSTAVLDADIVVDAAAGPSDTRPFLDHVRALVTAQTKLGAVPHPLNVVFGYVGYDTVARYRGLNTPPGGQEPSSALLAPRTAVVFDHTTGQGTMTAIAATESSVRKQLDEIRGVLSACISRTMPPLASAFEMESAEPDAQFEDKVRKALQRVSAGDAQQIGVSRAYCTPFTGDALDGYSLMKQANPNSPYSFAWRTPGATVAACSPMTFMTVDRGEAIVRPIAGTRRKEGIRSLEDLSRDLLGDEKERHELEMLVRQAEEDLAPLVDGRPQTQSEPEVLELANLIHTVSQVSGRLRPEVSVLDALLAGAPAGTVIGHPRVVAMNALDELESEGRGAYGGFSGWFSGDGSADTCLSIRMVVFANAMATCRAGAGVVEGSDPVSERLESEAKARSVLGPLGRTV